MLSDIYATSKALEQAHQGITNQEMADLLGVPVGMLEEAQAAGFNKEDEANQEHYDDGNGDGEVPQEQDFVSTYDDKGGAGLAARAFADAEDYD